MRAPAFEEGIWLVEFVRQARGRVVPTAGADRAGAVR